MKDFEASNILSSLDMPSNPLDMCHKMSYWNNILGIIDESLFHYGMQGKRLEMEGDHSEYMDIETGSVFFSIF